MPNCTPLIVAGSPPCETRIGRFMPQMRSRSTRISATAEVQVHLILDDGSDLVAVVVVAHQRLVRPVDAEPRPPAAPCRAGRANRPRTSRCRLRRYRSGRARSRRSADRPPAPRPCAASPERARRAPRTSAGPSSSESAFKRIAPTQSCGLDHPVERIRAPVPERPQLITPRPCTSMLSGDRKGTDRSNSSKCRRSPQGTGAKLEFTAASSPFRGMGGAGRAWSNG